jgi:hypothetical protein
MLNDYLANDLLYAEFKDRNWLLKNVDTDEGWLGGSLIVPFEGSQASSVEFGALPASTDVAESVYVRGEVTTQPEVWMTLKFNQRDLFEHNKVSEQNFLKLLPGEIDRGLNYLKDQVSIAMLNGTFFATATADGDSSGNITVDRPDRFVIGQKVSVDDDNSAPVSGYVRTINMDTGVVVLYDARSGGAVVNLSGYTTAQNARVYWVGSQSNGFTSLKSSLLSSANGGSSTLYGQTKLAYPYLQAIQVNGSDVTSANILQKLFDGYTRVRTFGKGNPSKVVMSFRNLGWVMTALEGQKGAYHVEQGSTKVSAFGWTEIDIVGVKGRITVVGVVEMDNDYIMYLDMSALKLYSNGGFKKRQSPDGKQYFEVRETTGFYYLVDTCFFGDLVLLAPSKCGIMYSIPSTDNA